MKLGNTNQGKLTDSGIMVLSGRRGFNENFETIAN